ncbi:MAG TPA: hypothetical protein VFP84_02560 [Kofleriaceae bacterium]|nr:hypothetical protein [Kofleriaceae bacterium]
MARRALWLVGLVAGVLGASGDAPSAEPASAIAVIVYSDNTTALSASDLEDMFRRRKLAWPDGERVIPLNAVPESELRKQFDRVVLGMSPEEVARYWLDQRIRGAGSAPREVGDVFLTLKLIGRLKGAIGYVPGDADRRGVRTVAWIRDGKLVMR